MAVCQFCRRDLTDADDQRRLTICRVCAPPPYSCDHCETVQSEWPDVCPGCGKELPRFRAFTAGLGPFLSEWGGELIEASDREFMQMPGGWKSRGLGVKANVGQRGVWHRQYGRPSGPSSSETCIWISTPYSEQAEFALEVRRSSGGPSVETNNDTGAKALLDTPQVRQLIDEFEPNILSLVVSGGVVHVQLDDLIADREAASALRELLAATLNRLDEIGDSVIEPPPAAYHCARCDRPLVAADAVCTFCDVELG